MLQDVKYVLEKISTVNIRYSCKEWKNYNKHRIYITRNGEPQGFINVKNNDYWLDSADYNLLITFDKFEKYYGKTKDNLLKDVKQVLNKIQQKESNSDALYTAEQEIDKIIVTKFYWYNQRPGEPTNEIVLGYVNINTLDYTFPYFTNNFNRQYEVFNNIFYTDLISKLHLYKEENNIKNLNW